jgi:hypothetical protein
MPIMENIKFIGIRPLNGCHLKQCKILKPGKVYSLYADYIFVHEASKEENDVISIEHEATMPDHFFFTGLEKNGSLKSINISAVAGKNGTGKSSLLELLFSSIYLYSVHFKTLPRNPDEASTQISEIDEKIEELNKQKEDAIHDKELDIKKPITGNDIYQKYEDRIIDIHYKIKNIEYQIERLVHEKKSINKLLSEIKQLRKQLKVEMFYELNGEMYVLRIKDKIELFKFDKDTDSLGKITWRNQQHETINPSQNFFYSIVLNYSHHALNSKDMGTWLSELFHKNDGYQTPIVINPMRTDGIIDINTENHLVRSRLLSLVLSPVSSSEGKDFEEKSRNSTRCLIDDKIARRIKIELNYDKFNKEEEEGKTIKVFYSCIDEYGTELWPKIEAKYLTDKDSARRATQWDDYAKEYIIGKLLSMSIKYPPYKDFSVNEKFVKEKFDLYLDEILTDKSHITFKFFQAINFLKYDYAKEFELAEQIIGIEDLSVKLQSYSKHNLITLVPPSFLKVDIIFSPTDDDDSLNNMSSGEKQKIYSSSSLIYHLTYLDSVKQGKDLPHKYKKVNIVFDEIELYYHPELQRNFISDFLKSVSRVKFENIDGINCTFITHAPFILSDIPKQNVLSLTREIVAKKTFAVPVNIKDAPETFAANIHTMLLSTFFMNATVGEFAKEKINRIAQDLSSVINSRKDSKADPTAIIRMIAELKIHDFKQQIELIGDPVVRDKLFQMYFLAVETADKEALKKYYQQKLNNL